MVKQVRYVIEVEISDYANEEEYIEMRDEQLFHLEMAVESPVLLVGSDIESEEEIRNE
jgi:hypothetical protein